MGVIDWKSKNIEDELSIYILVSQSFVDQLGESLRIKKGKRICPIAKTISQCFKALKTCLILQQSPQLWLGDKVLCYRRKIKCLILASNCRYHRFAQHLNLKISLVKINPIKLQYLVYLIK